MHYCKVAGTAKSLFCCFRFFALLWCYSENGFLVFPVHVSCRRLISCNLSLLPFLAPFACLYDYHYVVDFHMSFDLVFHLLSFPRRSPTLLSFLFGLFFLIGLSAGCQLDPTVSIGLSSGYTAIPLLSLHPCVSIAPVKRKTNEHTAAFTFTGCSFSLH